VLITSARASVVIRFPLRNDNTRYIVAGTPFGRADGGTRRTTGEDKTSGRLKPEGVACPRRRRKKRAPRPSTEVDFRTKAARGIDRNNSSLHLTANERRIRPSRRTTPPPRARRVSFVTRTVFTNCRPRMRDYSYRRTI